MYFSNVNKLSKLLSLILVCVLMGTLFAGCKKDDAANETTANTLPGLNLVDPTETQETEPEETVPEETEPKENMGTVTQQMNIRGTPSMQAAVLGTLYAGDRVEIVRRESVVGHTWGYIQNPVEGWVVMDYVEMDNPEDTGSVGANDTPASTGNATTPSGTTTGTTKGVINGNGVNIRSEASTNGTIQGTCNKGDVVTILETKDGWGRTDKGWVKMDFVTLSGGTTTNTNTNTNTGANVSGNGSTAVVAKGIVKVNELNIRANASTDGERLGNYTYGARVEILEKNGSWGRTDKGWIHMDYIYQDGTTGAKSDWGTITGNGLNIRSGPGTGYGTQGSYSSGDRVKILEQFTYGNTTWGCTDKGWISLDYVDLDNGNNTTTGGNGGGTTNRTGTGTVTRGLNIRDGAGTGYDIIGDYDAGDEVTILEATNGWGRTEDGWISLAYVDFDGVISDAGDDETRDQGTVTTGIYIREGAGTDYAAVGGLTAGTRVTILEIDDNWGRINSGWICLDYVDMD